MPVKLADVFVSVTVDDRNLDKGLNQVNRKVSRVGSGINRALKGAIGAGMSAAAAAVAAGLVGIGAAAVGLSKSLSLATDEFENMSKFAAVFRDNSQRVIAELDEFAAATGRSRFELRNMAAVIQDTFVPLGFARNEASDLSVSLTKLAVDVASFNNEAAPDVMNAFTSAIVGNHEAVRRFGIVITESTLNAELMRMGIEKGTKAATEQQKALARLNIIQRSTTDAQNDAIRTADSAANATRRLQSVIRDTATDIGLTFLPIWSKIINVVANFAAQVGPRLAEFVRNTVTNWLNGLAGMEGSTARSLGRTAGLIVGFGQMVVKWGANIVSALAQGIMGAIGLVAQAIQAIGKMISSWLAPGSPPRLLPDLPDWGKAAADEWLKGWTQADFGIIGEVGRAVGDILRGQGVEGAGLFEQIAGTRGAVADAIQNFKQTGQVGAEAFERIRRAAGSAGDEIVGLVRRQIELARASEKVAKIESALTAVQEKQQAIQERRQLADIRQRLAEGGLDAEERNLLLLEAQEISLRQRAREAQKEQATREDELATFKERLGIQQESLNLAEQLKGALEGAASAGEKIGQSMAQALSDLPAALEGAIPSLEELGIVPDFSEQFGKISELIESEFKPGFEEGQNIAQEFSLRVEEAFDRILEKIENVLELLGIDIPEETQAAASSLAEVPGSVEESLLQMDGTVEGFSDRSSRLGRIFEGIGDKLGQIAPSADNLTGAIQRLSDVLSPIADLIAKATEKAGLFESIIVGIGTAFATAKIIGLIITLAGAIGGAGGLTGALVGLLNPLTLIPTLIAILAVAWVNNWGDIQGKTRAVLDWLMPKLSSLKNWLSEKIPEAIGGLKATWLTLVGWWNETFKPAIKGIIGFFGDLKAGIEGLFAPLDNLGKKFDGLKGKAKNLGEKGLSALKNILPGSPPPLAEGAMAVSRAMEQLAGRGMRRLEQASRKLGHRQRGTPAMVKNWEALIGKLKNLGEVSGEFSQDEGEKLQERMEDLTEVVGEDGVNALEDWHDALDSVLRLVRSQASATFSNLSRNLDQAADIVQQSVTEINDAIDNLNIAPIQTLDRISSLIPQLEQVRDLLQEIAGIDVPDIDISTTLQPLADDIVARVTGFMNDNIVDILLQVHALAQRILLLVSGTSGALALQGVGSVGVPQPAVTPIDLSGFRTTTQPINQTLSFGPFVVNEDLDVELVARRIARIIQERNM